MKIEDLTEDQIKSMSELELLDMQLNESCEKVFETREKFSKLSKHFFASTLLAILGTFIFLPILSTFTPLFFIPSIIFLILLNRASNDKKTALISFKMSVLFFKENGIVDSTNEYLVKKYTEKIY